MSKKMSVSCSFSDDKIEAMKQKARELSKMIVKKSKTVTNQQITPSEICNNSEYCPENDKKPSQNDTGFLQNNYQHSTLMDNEDAHNSSCSKNTAEELSLDTTELANYSSLKKNSKHFKDKYKKPKIPYLVKCDVYQEEQVDSLTSKKQDDYVLEKLFNKSGIYYRIIYK